jgi:hypothetical protein
MSGARSLSLLVLLTVLSMFAVAPAEAVITNPAPGLFGDDDGGALFLPMENVLSAEIFDLGGLVADSEFGFFFANSSETLIPIFEVGDQRPPQQWARIDFGAGEVWDGDENVLQNTFSGSGLIGFYLLVTNLPGGEDFLAFSVPSMNPDGLDLFASFPSLFVETGYLFGFESPEVRVPVSFNVAVGLQKAPVPATPLLMLAGLAALVAARRKRV